MASLLKIASCVEAAVEAYSAVKPAPNFEKWNRHFDQEKFEASRQFRLLKSKNNGASPALHPTLAALFMVLDAGADFSEIARSHPRLTKNKYYLPEAKFPDDISDLLPPIGERWWETLAAEARRGREARKAPLPRVRLLLTGLPPPPPPLRTEQECDDVEMDEVDQELDELENDEYVPPPDLTRRPSTSGRAAGSRKRKGATSPEPIAAKRRAGPSQQEAASYKFECDRCVKAGEVCKTDPLRPCRRCTEKKLGCSLMPINEKTGKADRSKLSAEAILAYRIRQQETRKGKQPARGPLRRGAMSGSGASPSELLSALEIDSGSSHSPAEADPTALEAPARASARGAEIPSASFYIEVPAPPKSIYRSAAAAATLTTHRSAAAASTPATARSPATTHAPTSVPTPTTATTPAAAAPANTPASAAPTPVAPTPAAPTPAAPPHAVPTSATPASATPAPAAPASATPASATPASATPASATLAPAAPTTVAPAAPTSVDTPTPAPTPSSSAEAATLVGAASPGVASPQSAADSPASGLGSSPALAPALRRFIGSHRHWESGPGSPSRQRQNDTGATQGSAPNGDLADRIQALERRVDEIDEWRRRDEEWKRQDREWKRQVEERLRLDM